MLSDLFKLTLPEIIELLSLLRLDVYFALFLFGIAIPHVSVAQFVEDKFCINTLGLKPSDCLHLEQLGSLKENYTDQVYTFSTTFRNYQHLISTPPGIILAVFMGYWIDSYPKHLKYLLALPCLGGCLSAIYTIYNVIYFEMDVFNLLWTSAIYGFSGGIFIVMTGSYTYITRRTRTKYRAARFAILELFILTSIPIATVIGGKVISSKPWFTGHHRNYLPVLFISLVCKFVAMVWVLIFINDAHEQIDDPDCMETVDRMVELHIKPDDGEMVEIDLDLPKKENIPSSIIAKDCKETKPTGCIPIFLDIFKPSTVANMIKICIRKRPNNGRKILWNLMLAMNVLLIGHMGENTIGFPFAQKVYHWDVVKYSYITSIMMIIPTLSHSFLPIILIHKFHFSDTSLAIIGAVSLISSLTVKGGILEPCAFYISTVVGLCAGLLPVAIRSILSRIIDKDEAGQVFALLAAIESSGPMVASVVYSTLFNKTIHNFPGLVHHFASFTMFYPLGVVLWLDITKYRWDVTAINALKEKKRQYISAKESGNLNNNPHTKDNFSLKTITVDVPCQNGSPK